ncbi:MAG: Hsp33 family molecular chaperone HslO [Clostridium sp.]|nr:Hsp33 family molecular chaperone HslO [Clostridium sp.]
MEVNHNSDVIIRATAENASIVALFATTKHTTETARLAHGLSSVTTAALGRLQTAAAMMAIFLKGAKDLLTVQILGDGPIGGMTVTADTAGHVKGYANNPWVELPLNHKGKLDVSGAIGAGHLRVIKDLGLKEPYIGQVPLKTGEIAEDFTEYFATSEQIPSAVGLGVLVNPDQTVRQAGGFLIQLMPYCAEETIQKLERSLEHLDSVTQLLEQENDPEAILRHILHGMDVQIAGKSPVSFTCDCSKERVQRALISIGKEECEQIIQDGEDLEISCRFCGAKYHFGMEEFKTICGMAF